VALDMGIDFSGFGCGLGSQSKAWDMSRVASSGKSPSRLCLGRAFRSPRVLVPKGRVKERKKCTKASVHD